MGFDRLLPRPGGKFGVYKYNKHYQKYFDLVSNVISLYDFAEAFDDLEFGDIDFTISSRSPTRDNNFAITRFKIDHKKNGDLSVKCDSHIEVFVLSLMLLTEDIWTNIKSTNTELFDMIFTLLVETMIAHEMRHIHQLLNVYNKPTDDQVIICEDDTYTFSDAVVYELEKDANKYMLSKVNYTTIGDTKLKDIITRMEYLLTKIDIIVQFEPDRDVSDIIKRIRNVNNELVEYVESKNLL